MGVAQILQAVLETRPFGFGSDQSCEGKAM